MTKASGSIDLKSLNIAGKEVNKYITTINDGGIKVHDIDKQNMDYAQIDSNGLTVYQNTAKIAEFGSSIRLGLNEAQVIIGNENGTNQTSHITIDNGGINIYRESDLVMHLGEHTTIGRENKSQLAIENGFLQFSSYVINSRISQFEIGDANTKKTTYTSLLPQEIEIGSSYFIDDSPDSSRWSHGYFEIFYNPNEYPYPDMPPSNEYGSITVEDYYTNDSLDHGDPTWYASVIKICLGDFDSDFNPEDPDLYLGFNGDVITDNYYGNDSGIWNISMRPIRWFLYGEQDGYNYKVYLILPLNFVYRSGTNPYTYHWDGGDTQLTRPNGRFTNMSIMLYKCNNPNNSFSSFKPYLTFGNRTVTENGNDYIEGDYSVTFGKNLINTVDNCFVIGKNNIEPNSGDLFVIGTGSDTSHRANSFKIDGSGYLNVVDGFQIKVNNNQLMTLGTTGIRVGKETTGYVSIVSTGMDIYAGSSNINLAHFGYDSTETSTEESSSVISNSPFFSVGQRRTVISLARGDNSSVINYVSNRYNYEADQEMPVPPGSYSTVIGYDNVAIGPNSCAEGNNTIAYGADAHSEGVLTAAIGMSSHAEGCITEASGSYSHAEGYNTKANRGYSHAEGWGTEANELYSHAEGYNTKANGGSSHAEGYNTKANGSYSHAGGSNTTANGYAQTVIGRYNIISPSSAQSTYDATVSPYVFIIGNGTGNSNRSNALTVDWNGNVLAAGKITSPLLAGVIQMYGGSTIPTGWLECNGQSLLRTDYPELFAAIGTTWGYADSTHFNLPDLRGRAPIGAGTGSGLTARTLGTQNIGTENAIVPYHRHASYKYVSDKLGSGSTGARIYNPTGDTGTVMYTGYAGTSGNATGANMQPSAVVKFIICTGK